MKRPRVKDLLELVVEDYELHGKANLPTVQGHVALLTDHLDGMTSRMR